MLEEIGDGIQLWRGDCLAAMDELPENSVDAVCTDPPYHLTSIVKRFGGENAAPAQFGTDGVYARGSAGFMGKVWDGGDIAFRPETWARVLRVLKPGGHLVAFSATKNSHRMVCAIEDAGFEIRDSLAWMYATGFPKSLDVSKAIDKAAGAEREVVGKRADGRYAYLGCDITGGRTVGGDSGVKEIGIITAPATDAARQWEGWGTALKPAYEPICLARKPLGSGDIDVRKNVECALRKMGVTTEIVWAEESVETASRPNRRRKSSPENAESSAENASALEIAHIASETETRPTHSTVLGMPATGKGISPPLETGTSEPKTLSSITTAGNVLAAERPNNHSSLLTILEGEEQSTEERSGTESITTSSSAASLPDTESFAGIATGLSGSQEHALIKRKGNSFVWPKGLPTFVPSKPLNVAANVLRWGTGALNIDACRVETGESIPKMRTGGGQKFEIGCRDQSVVRDGTTGLGRWPANVCHDGSDEVVGTFPDAGGGFGKRGGNKNSTSYGFEVGTMETVGYGDSGSAARFFYSAKASNSDRAGSKHPTVKPISLMQWLVRMVCPLGGVVLDPFAGSGTTGAACRREGLRAILIEREDEYVEDIIRRISTPEPIVVPPQPKPKRDCDPETLPLPFKPRYRRVGDEGRQVS